MDAAGMMPIEAFAGITFTFYALAFGTTVTRLYTRAFVVSYVGADDYLITIGTLCTLAVALLSYYGSLSYIRIYDASISVPELYNNGLMDYETPSIVRHWDLGFRYDGIMELVYSVALPLVKCSIIAFFCRVKSMSGSCTLLYIFMAVIAIHGIINFAVTIASYDPLVALWTMFTFPGEFKWRFLPTTIQLSNTCLQVVFDIIILALPLPFLLKMKLRRNKKIALMIVYFLSFASFAVTLIRLVQCIDFRQKDHAEVLDPYKAFVSRVFYIFWTIMEVNTVIIVANLPALYALWRHSRENRETGSSIPPYFIFSSIANAFRSEPAATKPATAIKETTVPMNNYPDIEKQCVETREQVDTEGSSSVSSKGNP